MVLLLKFESAAPDAAAAAVYHEGRRLRPGEPSCGRGGRGPPRQAHHLGPARGCDLG
ncbi:MAG TPA: hypothetical protein VL242_44795 [Sorangium sp.]|nr:hypothetical protein [Sorangium sp.]